MSRGRCNQHAPTIRGEPAAELAGRALVCYACLNFQRPPPSCCAHGTSLVPLHSPFPAMPLGALPFHFPLLSSSFFTSKPTHCPRPSTPPCQVVHLASIPESIAKP